MNNLKLRSMCPPCIRNGYTRDCTIEYSMKSRPRSILHALRSSSICQRIVAAGRSTHVSSPLPSSPSAGHWLRPRHQYGLPQTSVKRRDLASLACLFQGVMRLLYIVAIVILISIEGKSTGVGVSHCVDDDECPVEGSEGVRSYCRAV